MKRIKIIHIVESLNIGGLERIVESLCLGMDKYKYDVRVYCVYSGGEIADTLLAKGVNVNVLGIKQYYNPFNIIKLYKVLKKDNPDIVQTHGYFSSVIGRLAALLSGGNVIINHVHSTFNDLKTRNVLIDKFLNKFTDAIIFVSKASRESYRKAGYNIDKSIIIYNGVDGAAYTINKDPLNEKIISIVASLRPCKGHSYLLNAISLAVKEIPDIKLWIIGDGSLKDKLESEVIPLGIEKNVIFWGEKNNVGELLGKTSVFILSSLREGLPVSLVEAMASALPIIGTDVGGVPEIVKNKENGFIVPACDERALCKAILDMFCNDDRLEKMGQRSRELFDRFFSLQHMTNKLDVLYMNLLKKTR